MRLNLLRAMYLLIVVGLGLTVWPDILRARTGPATEGTVILALLGGLSLTAFVGLWRPVLFLPILVFELLWKLTWVLAFGLPAWTSDQMDAYTRETLFACGLGLVLVPLVIPWKLLWWQIKGSCLDS